MRKVRAIGATLLAGFGWSAFFFMLAGPRLLHPPQYHAPEIQASADTFQIGYLAAMGFLYICALGHAVWLGKMIWKKEI